ncbi:MAG: FUSC family protein [Candidatus Nanopelagicales bacterium]
MAGSRQAWTYSRAVLRSVMVVDRTKMRRWSAIRRGVLVLGVMVVATAITDAETGALAAVAALFVGLQDRGAAPRYTVRIMFAESLLLAAVVAVGSHFSTIPLIPGSLLVLTAFAAGLSAQHDKAMSRMFGDVMPVAAFLGIAADSQDQALVWGAAVLAGGLVQSVFAMWWVRIEGDIPERRTVAAALMAVADHLDDALVRRSKLTGKAAEDRLAEAAGVLGRSDLSHDRRHALRKLLADAEVLRQEAAALRVRKALHLAVIEEQEVREALVIASLALRETAAALTSVGVPGRFDAQQEAALAELYPCRLVAEQLAADQTYRPTARAIGRQILRLYRHVAELVSAAESRTSRHTYPLREGMVAAFRHPTRRDLVSGLRLGAATIIALLLARVLEIPHGSWVAATTVALLRPDYRALTSDTVARALGTALGAALVLPLLFVIGDNHVVASLMVGVVATGVFAIVTVNEGLFVVAMTVQTVFSRSVVGEDPLAVARLRLLDVLLGCALALLLLLTVRISHGGKLARDMSRYADATAQWVDAVYQLASGEKAAHKARLRRAMRAARVEVQHGLELRVIEPLGAGISAWFGQVVFTRIHDAARAVAAAERSLKHGDATGESTALFAADISDTLRAVAVALASGKLPKFLCVPPDLPVDGDDAIGLLMRFADQEVHAALAAITQPAPEPVGTGPGLGGEHGWAPYTDPRHRRS